MAHYALIGRNNKVIRVVKVDNSFMGSPEKETTGETFLTEVYGINCEWVQGSYNTKAGVHSLGGTPLRANFPSVGMIYDDENDIFHEPRPKDKDGQSCASWTLDTTDWVWKSPVPVPTMEQSQYTHSDGNPATYRLEWSEANQQWIGFGEEGAQFEWDPDTSSWNATGG